MTDTRVLETRNKFEYMPNREAFSYTMSLLERMRGHSTLWDLQTKLHISLRSLWDDETIERNGIYVARVATPSLLESEVFESEENAIAMAWRDCVPLADHTENGVRYWTWSLHS